MWSMVQKEYRQRARGNATVGMIITYTLILGCTSFFIYLPTYTAVTNQMSSSDTIGRALSTGTLIAQMIMALLLALSLNAASIATEKDQETFDLLNLTLYKSREIVLGKYLSSTGFLFILLLTALPIYALAFTFGGVALETLWRSGLIVAGMTLLISSAGLLFSLISVDLRAALGSSFLALVLLGAVTGLFAGLLHSSFDNAPPNPLVYWLGALSMLLNPLWAAMDTLGTPIATQIRWATPMPIVVPALVDHLWIYGPVFQIILAAGVLAATSLIYPRYRAGKSGGAA